MIDCFVITLLNNQTSVAQAKECMESCENLGMSCYIWQAFDGTGAGSITIPNVLPPNMDLAKIKITSPTITKTEVACALSHISLWFHAVHMKTSLVVLEHDAKFIRQYNHHMHENSICYLGCKDQLDKNLDGVENDIFSFKLNDQQYKFIDKAHAYSIDVNVAEELIEHVICFGIYNPIDVMMGKKFFNIVQPNYTVFAYENETHSTIERGALQ